MTAAVPLTVSLASGQALVLAGGGRIVFLSALETSGVNPAVFTFYNGNPSTNVGVMDVSLSANESTREEYPHGTLGFNNDLWIGGITGVGTIRVHIVPADLWPQWRRELLLPGSLTFDDLGVPFGGVEVPHHVQ